MTTFTILSIAYLLGSVPFALIIGTQLGGVDVRRVGSGNLGAANVYRATRPLLGISVLLLDFGKGSAAVMIAGSHGSGPALPALAACAAVAGHVWPVWLRFRGGRGVATAGGAFGVLAPAATLVAAALFVVMVWTTRYVSLGSIVASASLPLLAYVTEADRAAVVAAVAVATIVLYRHWPNLERLQAGTERRIEGLRVNIHDFHPGAAGARGSRRRPRTGRGGGAA